ncbi:GNAT family N-acetyltransferase [Gorillibacterium timonense]|uniref:GNAT family N-acetyltransferase n=1 Tax=Gorillibacterium timonense TaxID=1689269 RepID=UPI00071D709B|nr:GNAT family N-acetyltransferase [Gorillibacterium timonense]
MKIEIIAYPRWEEAAWSELGPIYRDSFPHGAKPEAILRRMIDRGLAVLHGAYRKGEAVGMAVTGFSREEADDVDDTDKEQKPRMIIDYLAVRQDIRGLGIGKQLFDGLKAWAVASEGIGSILIEAEAEDTPENRKRMQFWECLGFQSTSYIHQYRWVPEPYRALLLPLDLNALVQDDGKALFREITRFHELSFRKG